MIIRFFLIFIFYIGFLSPVFSDCKYTKTGLYSIQSTLNYLNLYNSKLDGKYGPGTERSILQAKKMIFQFGNRTSK